MNTYWIALAIQPVYLFLGLAVMTACEQKDGKINKIMETKPTGRFIVIVMWPFILFYKTTLLIKQIWVDWIKAE